MKTFYLLMVLLALAACQEETIHQVWYGASWSSPNHVAIKYRNRDPFGMEERSILSWCYGVPCYLGWNFSRSIEVEGSFHCYLSASSPDSLIFAKIVVDGEEVAEKSGNPVVVEYTISK